MSHVKGILVTIGLFIAKVAIEYVETHKSKPSAK